MGLSDKLHRNKLLMGGYSVRDYTPPIVGKHGLELHGPLANFLGPRTDLSYRLPRGVKPTTHTDAAAKKHDINYHNISQQLRKGTITRAAAYQKIKAADNALMKQAIANKATISPIEHLHSTLALSGMAGKRALQSVGAMPELAFVNADGDAEPELEGGRKKRRKKSRNPVLGLKKRLQKLKL